MSPRCHSAGLKLSFFLAFLGVAVATHPSYARPQPSDSRVLVLSVWRNLIHGARVCAASVATGSSGSFARKTVVDGLRVHIRSNDANAFKRGPAGAYESGLTRRERP